MIRYIIAYAPLIIIIFGLISFFDEIVYPTSEINLEIYQVANNKNLDSNNIYEHYNLIKNSFFKYGSIILITLCLTIPYLYNKDIYKGLIVQILFSGIYINIILYTIKSLNMVTLLLAVPVYLVNLYIITKSLKSFIMILTYLPLSLIYLGNSYFFIGILLIPAMQQYVRGKIS